MIDLPGWQAVCTTSRQEKREQGMPWDMANFWERRQPEEGEKQTAYCRSKTTTVFSPFSDVFYWHNHSFLLSLLFFLFPTPPFPLIPRNKAWSKPPSNQHTSNNLRALTCARRSVLHLQWQTIYTSQFSRGSTVSLFEMVLHNNLFLSSESFSLST